VFGSVQVVEKIKAVPSETRLLVVDQAADRYFADNGIAVSGEMSCVEHIICPATKPYTGHFSVFLPNINSILLGDILKVACVDILLQSSVISTLLFRVLCVSLNEELVPFCDDDDYVRVHCRRPRFPDCHCTSLEHFAAWRSVI